MTLAERDDELAALAELLSASHTGDGAVAVIDGPIGSGKTALLDDFAELSLAAGYRLLTVTAYVDERMLAFGVMRQLFTTANLPPDRAGHVARLLDNGMLGAPAAGSGSSEETSVYVRQGLSAELVRLAARGPLAICVDDVHHADPQSVDCLTHFARRLRSTPVVLVLANALLAHQAHPLLRAELLGQRHCRILRLRPLSRQGIASILAESPSSGPLAEHHAERAHGISGGSPLLVNALIEDSRPADGSIRDKLITDAAFARAVTRSLYRCDGTARGVARALAVLDISASPAVLEGMLDLRPESVQRGLTILTAMGLIAENEFRHPDARAAVLNQMLPQERAALHDRAAQSLNGDGASARAIAAHLIAADSSDKQWAVPVLVEAAEQALTDGDVDFARRGLQLARRLPADDHEGTVISSLLAQAEWRVDPLTAARRFGEMRSTAHRAPLWGRPAARAIESLLWCGRIDEAEATLDKLTACAPGTEIEADIQLAQSWMSFLYPGASRQRSRGAVSGPEEVMARPQLHATALLTTLFAGTTAAPAAAEQVLWMSSFEDTTLAMIALSLLAYSDRADLPTLCRLLADEATARRGPAWNAIREAACAAVSLRSGDLRGAQHHASAALTQMSPRSWGIGVGAPLSSQLLAATAMGNYNDAVSQLSIPVPGTLFQTPLGLQYLHARGRYFLATKRLHAALNDFRMCGQLMTHWDVEHCASIPWRTGAAWAHLGLGDRRRARELAEDQLIRPGPAHNRTKGMALRVLAAAGESAKRPTVLNEAVEVLQDSGDRLEIAHALADLSRAYHALQENGQARVMRRRAHRLAEECGAETLARALVPDSRTTGPPEPATPHLSPVAGAAELSGAELRVARLVTVSTVEQHLTRVYRKLKVNSRTGLPRDLLPEMASAGHVAANPDW